MDATIGMAITLSEVSIVYFSTNFVSMINFNCNFAADLKYVQDQTLSVDGEDQLSTKIKNGRREWRSGNKCRV